MNRTRCDTLARSTASGLRTRRGLLRVLAGGAFAGVAGRVGVGDVATAKRKRKKKSHAPQGCGGDYPVQCPPTAEDPQDICFPSGTVCCGSALGGGACYAGQACCPPSLDYPSGSCAQADEHCCPADAGGGSCPLTHPTCCPPTEDSPSGFCSPSGVKCCNFGNIYCDANEDCCAPSYGYPEGLCVPRGMPCPDDWDRRQARQLPHARPKPGLSRSGERHLTERG